MSSKVFVPKKAINDFDIINPWRSSKNILGEKITKAPRAKDNNFLMSQCFLEIKSKENTVPRAKKIPHKISTSMFKPRITPKKKKYLKLVLSFNVYTLSRTRNVKNTNKGAILGFQIWDDTEIREGEMLVNKAVESPKKFPPIFLPSVKARKIERTPPKAIVKAIPVGFPEKRIKKGVKM